MPSTFFSSDIFANAILPFVLVFTLLFAILEKTKLLGEDKRQVNAIISLVIGLILISFPYPRDIIVKLMPFLAVLAVILLVFMLLYGFMSGNKSGDPLNKGLKITFGILIGLALLIFLAYVTGALSFATDFIQGQNSSTLIMNIVFVIIIAGVIAAVIASSGDKKE